MALTIDQRRAHADSLRGAKGRFTSRQSKANEMKLVSHVVPEYAATHLKRLGYGQKVIDECAGSLAERLNVSRDFSDEAFKEIARESFRDRFWTDADDYLSLRNALGNNTDAQAKLDKMLERDTPDRIPGALADKATELNRRPVFDVSDPLAQAAHPSVNTVSHQGIKFHKCNENTVYTDGRVEGVRVQSARPISDQEMDKMAELVAYESSAVLHATGTMSVPFRDSPNSFILRSVPKIARDERGEATIKQELSPRSSEKINRFMGTLAESMEGGSSYVRKDKTRALEGLGKNTPEGLSFFLALTPMERQSK